MIDANTVLPSIPDKRYFTIGEASDLCLLKPHVLRYWEQEFAQLNPNKRTGNRRYYQQHDILMVREIRRLLYAEGFTINGARQQLTEFKKQLKQQQPALDRQITLSHAVAELDEMINVLQEMQG